MGNWKRETARSKLEKSKLEIGNARSGRGASAAPGLDDFSAYSQCIVGMALAMVRTLVMYDVQLVTANVLPVQAIGCRRTKLKLHVGASLEPFGSFIAVFTVTTRSFTALL